MIKTIIMDEEGNQYSPLLERNETIISALAQVVERLEQEQKLCRTLKSKEKVGYRFGTQLYSKLKSFGSLSVQDINDITCEQVEANFDAFLQLIAHYNLTFEFVPNKQLFCAFMGITNSVYVSLLNSDDPEMRNLMNGIDDAILYFGLSASENGNADGKAVYNRISAHGVGHDVVKSSEQKMIETIGKTPAEMQKRLYAFFGNDNPKLNK